MLDEPHQPVSKKHSERGLNGLAAALDTEVLWVVTSPAGRHAGQADAGPAAMPCGGLYWGFLPLAEGDEPACRIVR